MEKELQNSFLTPSETVRLRSLAKGPLTGRTFAAKELFAVAGFVTGAGNPHWRASHEISPTTASAVTMLLDAGAELTGRTISDEMAFSLIGENSHYGTPLNCQFPERIPGGSSSGSAAAVGLGAVDFALGTDTGGSVRVPAAFCGIYGFRPTHGVVPITGVHPLAASFDVVGWFAKDPSLLSKVGGVLLQKPYDHSQHLYDHKLLIAADIMARSDRKLAQACMIMLENLEKNGVGVGEVRVLQPDIATWVETLRVMQWFELHQTHGEWIDANISHFGAEVRGRIAQVGRITESEYGEARKVRASLLDGLSEILTPNTIVVFPTTHALPILKGACRG